MGEDGGGVDAIDVGEDMRGRGLELGGEA